MVAIVLATLGLLLLLVFWRHVVGLLVVAALLLTGIMAANGSDHVIIPVLLAIALGVILHKSGTPTETPTELPRPTSASPNPDQPNAAPRERKGWLSRFRRNPDARLIAAWDGLASEASHAPNRVAVIRRSCDRARMVMKTRPLDPAAHELLVLLEKRIPELIESRLGSIAAAEPHLAEGVIDETLDLLEDVGAHCERLMSRSATEIGDPDAVLVAHIKARLRPDPLSRL